MNSSAVPRFWREIPARYNLVGTRCTVCGEYYFPPREMCPECRRDGKIEEYKFEGTGKVVTYTTIYPPLKGFFMQTPYNIAIIELKEGTRFTAQVICDPCKMKIGMKVKPVFRKIGEDGKEGIIYYGTKFVPE